MPQPTAVIAIHKDNDIKYTDIRPLRTAYDNYTHLFHHFEFYLTISGYDDDARELWDIPEVREYVKVLLEESDIVNSFGYDKIAPTNMMWFWFAVTLNRGVEINPQEVMKSFFMYVNNLTDNYEMTELQNQHLCAKFTYYLNSL